MFNTKSIRSKLYHFRGVIQSGQSTTVNHNRNHILALAGYALDAFAKIIDARKEYAEARCDRDVPHSVHFSGRDDCGRSGPHVQQVDNVHDDAEHQSKLDTDCKADDDRAQPGVEVTFVRSPEHQR